MIPVIASLVLAPMDAKAPDVEGVLRDLRACLNTFDDWAESVWSGSALEVEQVFKVGEESCVDRAGLFQKTQHSGRHV